MTNDSLVYLSVNGQEEWTPLSQARIPVLDRGFIFGDGIYEVVPVYAGKMFRAQAHMARMERSLATIGIRNLHTREEWLSLIQKLIATSSNPTNGLGAENNNQFIYLQITRGVAKRDHAFPQDATPTVFMMSSPLVLPNAQERAQGVAVVSHADERWHNCHIKSVSLLGNVLMKQFAVESGVAETIMFRDGFLSEGSSTNVWVVKKGVLFAPPRGKLILEGIRYGLIEELAQQNNIPFEMRPISEAEVREADELMLSSATREILAITTLDGQAVGHGIATGKPGEVYAKLYAGYQAAKAAL